MMTHSASPSADGQTLLHYTEWANARVLEAMQAADDVPDRAVELLSHLLRAQDVWYGRVEGTEHATLDFWVTEPLSACADRLAASTQRWRGVLEEHDALDEPVAYTNSTGTAFETPLRDIFLHVVNHGTHHRAQIALTLRQADIAPPATDYIYYHRDENADA